LFNSSWQIDHQFAVAQLSRYLEEISMIEAGVPFEDLGIRERKASQQTKVFSLQIGDYIKTGNFSSPLLSQEPDPDPEIRVNVDSPAPDLDEPVEVTASNVAHMHLTGTMFLQNQMSTRGVQSLVSDIREMNADPSFIGGVIEVDSGGGESLAGAALEKAVEESEKPLIALVHMALSAAYRGIVHCDRIVAISDSSQFGSIGSMLKIDKFLAEVDKLQFLTIYATQSPGKNKEFRAFQEHGDTSGLQSLVDQGAVIFQNVVRDARDLNSQAEETLSGGIFRTQDAITRGLADQVGGLSVAIKQMSVVVNSKTNSNQNLIDMSILKQLQNLFPGVSDEESAIQAIQQLQEAADPVEDPAADPVEDPASDDPVEDPASDDPVEDPASDDPASDDPAADPVEDPAAGQLDQIVNLLENQNSLLQDLTGRVTALEQTKPAEQGDRIAELAKALNKMKVKGVQPKIKSIGSKSGDKSLDTETPSDDGDDKKWKFGEKEMDSLYNKKKPRILHSSSIS